MMFDENLFKKRYCRKSSEVFVTFWRALIYLIGVRYRGLCAVYLAGPKKGGTTLTQQDQQQSR
jgi:hypothetical protein